MSLSYRAAALIAVLFIASAGSLGGCGFSASTGPADTATLDGPSSHTENSPEIAANAPEARPGGFVGSTTDSSEIEPGADCKADGSNCTKSTAADKPATENPDTLSARALSDFVAFRRPPVNPGPRPASDLKLCPPGWKNVSKVYMPLPAGAEYAPACFHLQKASFSDYLDQLTAAPWPAAGYTMNENSCMQLNEDGSAYKDPQSSYEGGSLGFYYFSSDYRFPDAPTTLTPESMQKLVEGLKANQVKVYPLLLAPKDGKPQTPANCPL